MKQDQNESNQERRQAAWHLLLLYLLTLFTFMVWVGCSPEAKVAAGTKTVGTNPGDVSAVGKYVLVTVDGKKVPCDVKHEGHTMSIKSGSFVINADGTCSSKIFLAGRDAAIEVKATYARQGSTLTMKWEGAGMTTGTVEGDIFTMNNEGIKFAYRK